MSYKRYWKSVIAPGFLVVSPTAAGRAEAGGRRAQSAVVASASSGVEAIDSTLQELSGRRRKK
jgi:hypothetical protein